MRFYFKISLAKQYINDVFNVYMLKTVYVYNV